MTSSDYAASFRLDGKRALVTGASQGIGTEIATALACAGASVVLSGRNVDRLESVAETLRERHGTRTAVVVGDLAEADSVEQLARDGVAALGGLEVLVNNAGISFPQPVVDTNVEKWDAVMAVNLRAPALLAARIGRAMAITGNGGKIINIASAAGLRPLSEHYAYCASKAALIMATKVLALELGPSGVRSNVVCPTVIMTEMGQRVWGEHDKAAPMLARIPLGHFGVPSDVAHTVVFLASSAADMINGVELAIDGGYSAT
jgi:NAD(P)-dependent dehydrogenase (short-subunit alcohol dehydrogenase family)